MKRFNKVAVVKEMSREAFGSLPRPKRIEDKRYKPPKHKKREEEL